MAKELILKRDFDLLDRYCEKHTNLPLSILADLERETGLKTLAPQMLSGSVQAAFLHFLVRISGAKKVLEVGSFTGYATLAIASALEDNGRVYTIEVNDEITYLLEKYAQEAGLVHKIVLKTGNALEIIPSLEIQFDLIFIDAGKKDYPKYYELLMPKLNSGGIILADNVLWSGKVVQDSVVDPNTEIIKAFNEMVFKDPRLRSMILPIRDGLMIGQKI